MIDKIEYKITGMGWAELSLGNNSGSYAIPFSYACEPLSTLLEALLKLNKKESNCELVVFNNETSECSLLLSIVVDGIVKVDIIEEAYFTVFKPYEDEHTPETVFTGYDSIFEFSQRFSKELNYFLKYKGEGFFMDKWLGEFPTRELRDLDEFLIG